MNAVGGSLVLVYVPVTPVGGSTRFELLAGETTDVRGLIVVPELTEDGRRFTGSWRIAHQSSGRPVTPPYEALEDALDAARRLGRVHLACWDRPVYEPAGQESAVAEMVRRALEPTLMLAAG